MTVFAVLLAIEQPALAQRIVSAFPSDHLRITETQWLISAAATAVEIAAKLGIVDPDSPGPPVGTGIVFATSGYYGRAPNTTWDWIKAKLEAGATNG
jgi:hypothetical protein